jgi:dTDP-4-amino-4,6-dideoxygalactose transaminase
MKIPWAIPNIRTKDIDYVKTVLDSRWYTMGKQVKLLEKNTAEYVGRKQAIAVNNGTAALEVMLRTMGISHGDEVIVPAISYIASATSVSLVGAKPIFADVDKTMTINPDCLDDKITDRTKAVMAVDLTGSPCNYDKLLKKCKEYDIELIVDGAQSLGSTYKGKSCLSYGLMSSTSFHAAKILTTVEGGMIFAEGELAKKARAIRNQGEGDTKYIHEYLGGNYRMTDISAAFAIKQLEVYDKTLRDRSNKVEYYKKLLSGLVDFLNIRDKGKTCNFIFLIFIEEREKLANFLKANGIDTRKIYPKTIPQQPIYNIKKSYPSAEWFCKHSLSLPLYSDLRFEQIKYVCDKIKEFLK